METPRYPNITELSLTPFRAIEIQLKGTPDLLDRPDCPYPPLVKAMLRRLVGGETGVDTGSDTEVNRKLVDASESALDLEIADLYATVKRDSANYTGSDMKDKMAFMKISGDLLTKIISIQEKRFNIKNMAQMQRTVVEALEEYLTPAQRTEFIEKMAKFNV
jgi:hypothetical protein